MAHVCKLSNRPLKIKLIEGKKEVALKTLLHFGHISIES